MLGRGLLGRELLGRGLLGRGLLGRGLLEHGLLEHSLLEPILLGRGLLGRGMPGGSPPRGTLLRRVRSYKFVEKVVCLLCSPLYMTEGFGQQRNLHCPFLLSANPQAWKKKRGKGGKRKRLTARTFLHDGTSGYGGLSK